MSRATPSSGFLPLTVLLLLLVVLASLQYRWLGEASRAEEERVRAAMEGAARRLAGDLDREVSRLYLHFHVDLPPGEIAAAEWQALRASWDEVATVPGLVEEVLLLQRPAGALTVERLEADPARWAPTMLEGEIFELGGWLEPSSERRGDRFGQGADLFATFPLLPRTPALVLPLFDLPDFRGHRDRPEPGAMSLLVLQLSRSVLGGALFEELEARHFPTPHWEGYGLTLLDASGQPIDASPTPAEGKADVELPTLALLPREALLRLAGDELERPQPQDDAPARPPFWGRRGFRGRPPLIPGRGSGDSRWRLVVHHPEGSVAWAVERNRRRNLAISFAVLGLLGASALFLLVNLRRGGALAARQLAWVAGVSHELRTPVAGIRSLAQNLAEGLVRDPDRVREYGRNLEAEGRRLADLVEQVLGRAGILSGQTATKRDEVNLREVVERALDESLWRVEEAGAELRRELPDDLPRLRGDGAALGRAVRNLVENAAKHAGAGEIVVEAEQRWLAEGRVVAISVADGGPGIPEDERQAIFDPFVRGARAREEQREGSGLGLGLVREIAAAHDGRVELAASASGGALFTLLLPVTRRAP